MSDIWNARRNVLESNVQDAVWKLLEHSGAAGCMLPLRDSKGIYIAVGTPERLTSFAESKREPGAAE